MSSREICKYFLHGACRNGASCRFSHEMSAPKSTVCTYYLAGNCAYGDKCRYDHVRPKDTGVSSGPSGPPPRRGFAGASGAPSMNTGAREFVPGGANALGAQMGRMHIGGGGYRGQPPLPPGAPAWRGGGGAAYAADQTPEPEEEDWGYVDEQGNWVSFKDGEIGGNEQEVEFLKSQLPSEDDFLDGLGADTGPPYGDAGGANAGDDEWGYYDDQNNWVSFGGATSEYLQAAGGQGDSHRGDTASSHPQHPQHPSDPFAPPPVSFEEAERVRALEEKLARSAEVECAVCLECVLEKPKLGDRRFGLLSGCDHAFCLQCIREWRDGGVAREAPEAQTSSVLDQARRCPICREQSHFITPSQHWPKDAAEKAATIEVYQGKMKKIPCRNFDYGDGRCPFGSSCFYRHAYRDGTEESYDVRKTTDGEGNLHIASEVRLSDFFETAQGRRAMRNA